MSVGRNESAASRGVRRAAGLLSIAGLVVAVIAGLAGYATLATFAFIVFIALPPMTMIVHLAATKSLSQEDKARWRRELRWSRSRQLIAFWAYLFAADLSQRARGLRYENDEGRDA